jgi:hypothetical protein
VAFEAPAVSVLGGGRDRCTASSPRSRWPPERRNRGLPPAGRSQHREDPRVAIDLQLLNDLELVEADNPPQSLQTLQGEAPVDEVIARVHLARIVNLDRRDVGRQARVLVDEDRHQLN